MNDFLRYVRGGHGSREDSLKRTAAVLSVYFKHPYTAAEYPINGNNYFCLLDKNGNPLIDTCYGRIEQCIENLKIVLDQMHTVVPEEDRFDEYRAECTRLGVTP